MVNNTSKITVAATFLIVALSLQNTSLWAHGGKTHSQGVTAMVAVQKAVTIYDSLIDRKKIDTSWETNLTGIAVEPWGQDKLKGWVVRFARSPGEPAALFIFIKNDGGYGGSNFTGEG